MNAGKLDKVACESDRNCGHAARLRHKQQSPAINERHRWMVCLADIRILAAHVWPSCGEFRINERADQRDKTAGCPCGEYQERRVHLTRDDVRIHEDSRTDDASH